MSTIPKYQRYSLLRTKTGAADDTTHADGATVPADADVVGFSGAAPAGKLHTAIELFVCAVDADGVAQARSGTYTQRVTHVVSRQADAGAGNSWPDVAADTQTITALDFQSLVRVPVNGGRVFVGLESIAGAPAGATAFQIWGKPVAE